MKDWLKKIGSSPFVQTMAGILIGMYLLFVYKTCRWRTVGLDNYRKDFPALFVFWHAEIAMIPLLTVKAGMDKPLWAIVSGHRDGRFASSFLKFLKVSSINGSTGHGGADAAIKAVKLIKEGNAIVGMCPDGPRGPANRLGMGALVIAKTAGVPVYCVTYAVKRHKILRTWDRFFFPFPFSSGVMMMTEPFYIEADTDDREGLEISRQKLEKLMNDNSARARTIVNENRGDKDV